VYAGLILLWLVKLLTTGAWFSATRFEPVDGTGKMPKAVRIMPTAMAIFSSEDAKDQRRDWAILRDGGVALYWRPEVLKKDVDWLQEQGYDIVEFDAGKWSSEDQMHDSLRSALAFPYYYSKNLDALNECMWDDLVVSDSGGTVLVFHHYDQFAKIDQRRGTEQRNIAQVVLDILACAIRYHMLFGRRLLILVQSDDPTIRFDDLAGVSAGWNPREWLNKSRGL
jgi:RNAse (barnase) inhibitor barstar